MVVFNGDLKKPMKTPLAFEELSEITELVSVDSINRVEKAEFKDSLYGSKPSPGISGSKPMTTTPDFEEVTRLEESNRDLKKLHGYLITEQEATMLQGLKPEEANVNNSKETDPNPSSQRYSTLPTPSGRRNSELLRAKNVSVTVKAVTNKGISPMLRKPLSPISNILKSPQDRRDAYATKPSSLEERILSPKTNKDDRRMAPTSVPTTPFTPAFAAIEKSMNEEVVEYSSEEELRRQLTELHNEKDLKKLHGQLITEQEASMLQGLKPEKSENVSVGGKAVTDTKKIVENTESLPTPARRNSEHSGHLRAKSVSVGEKDKGKMVPSGVKNPDQPECSGNKFEFEGYQPWRIPPLGPEFPRPEFSKHGFELPTIGPGSENSEFRGREAAANIVKWDFENCPKPQDCSLVQLSGRIRMTLKRYGLRGPTTIKAIVSNVRPLPKELQERFTREYRRVARERNQPVVEFDFELDYAGITFRCLGLYGIQNASDIALCQEMSDWPSTTAEPENFLVISGDRGFWKTLEGLVGRDHRAMVSMRAERCPIGLREFSRYLDIAVSDWRYHLLGLPELRHGTCIYGSESEEEKEEKKKKKK